MRLTPFFSGVLGLAALEVVTSSPGAANRTAAIPVALGKIARRILDPDIALLPNWHDNGASAEPIDPATKKTLNKLLTVPTGKQPEVAPKPKAYTPPGSLGWVWKQPTGG